MIQLRVRIAAVDGQIAALIDALRSVARRLRIEGLCSDVHVVADADDPNLVCYCEDWPDVEAFEQHLRSDRFARVLSAMEAGAEPPVFECRVVTEVRGLEYLAAVRGVAAPAARPPRSAPAVLSMKKRRRT